MSHTWFEFKPQAEGYTAKYELKLRAKYEPSTEKSKKEKVSFVNYMTINVKYLS